MKKTDYFSGQQVLEDDLEYSQTSLIDGTKERLIDFNTIGIVRDGISNFHITTQALTNTYYINISSGIAYNCTGERILINTNTNYDSSNPTRTINGISVPLSSGNINIPLENYNNSVVNNIWLEYLETRDSSYTAIHPETGCIFYPHVQDGYNIKILTSNPYGIRYNNAIYLGSATGQGIGSQPIISCSNREYILPTFYNGITVFNPEGISICGSSISNIGIKGDSSIGTGVQGQSVSGYGIAGTSTSSHGVVGNASFANAHGVWGNSTKFYGVYGVSASCHGVVGCGQIANVDGVQGYSTSHYGIYGYSTNCTGVYGDSIPHIGVVGNSGVSTGVQGQSVSGYGVAGTSTSSHGVVGNASFANAHGVWGNSTKFYGVYGVSASCHGIVGCGQISDADGVQGYSTSHYGVYGVSASCHGIVGCGQVSNADGVQGYSISRYGIYGCSENGIAINGFSVKSTAINGVSVSESGICGSSTNCFGVKGTSTNSIGVLGVSAVKEGVCGFSSACTGVYGDSTSQIGVVGNSVKSIGVQGQSTSLHGVVGCANFTGVFGVFGTSVSSHGVVGCANFTGVFGVFGESSSSHGIVGCGHFANAYGVQGYSTSHYGIYGISENSHGVVGCGQIANADGVQGYSTSHYGIYGITGAGDNNYGLYTPDNLYAANKASYISDSFINAESFNISTGDIIRLKGTDPIYFQNSKNPKIPVSEVVLSDKEDDILTLGVVTEIAGTHPEDVEENESNDWTIIPSGKRLSVLTCGTFAHCKVETTQDSINMGDRLTSSNIKGYARKFIEGTHKYSFARALESIPEGLTHTYISVLGHVR